MSSTDQILLSVYSYFSCLIQNPIILSFQIRTWKALWVTSSGCFWALQINVTWQILDNFVRCWTVSMLCDQLIASLESSHYFAVLFNVNNSRPDLISGLCYRMVLLLLTKYICFNQSRDKLCIIIHNII